MNILQILAIAIFVSLFVALTTGKVYRYIPALITAALMSMLLIGEPKTLLRLN